MTAARQNNRTGEWQDRDSRHYLHPFTDYKELDAKGSRIITRADGIYIWDSDGQLVIYRRRGDDVQIPITIRQ